MTDKDFYDYDVSDVLGFSKSIKEPDVNYYEPNCLVFTNDKDKKQVQIFFDDDTLIKLIDILSPIIEKHKQEQILSDLWAKECEGENDN